MLKPALLSLAICAPLIASGCVAAAVGTGAAVGVAAAQDRTMGEAVDDATMSNEIKAKLLNEGGLGEVDVEVAQGLVLLSGRVSSPEQRVRAEDLAWSSTRTRDVANEIVIERPGGFFKNASDELITARVRASLVGSSEVKSVNYNIETYNGVVYLMGIARTKSELNEATRRASIVGGVQRVVSYVRVRDSAYETRGPARDDELAGGPSS